MRIVHINKRAAVAFLITIFITGALIVSLLPNAADYELNAIGKKLLLARDVNARVQFQRERPPLKMERMSNISNSKELLSSDGVLSKNDNSSDAFKREFIRNMTLHAWNGYKKYAWGENEVKPISKTPFNQGIFGGGQSGLAATIVDSIDTLWIMGLQQEYEEARDFIKESFNISKAQGTISVFETNIRFLGGLLSVYALSKEKFFIEKAKGVGDMLLNAFNTPTGIPKSVLNTKTGLANNYGWVFKTSSVLAEIGSMHLEFIYLSQLTSDPVYKKKVQAVRDHLDQIEKIDGLYANYISEQTGEWTSKHVSLGAMGDSFYEYLVKAYVQSDKKDVQAWRMYMETIDVVRKVMVQKSSGGLTYVAEWRNGVLEHKMGHLACFCVGMFALQADLEQDEIKKQKTMELAEELGRTCHESYIRSATGLGPEMFYFSSDSEAKSLMGENGYILRPEVIEGWFYLWRFTGKVVYKEWIWNAINAIEEYCRKDAGYAGLLNVYDPDRGSDDVQQSFFIAETLKYAYLAFTDNSVISLNDWVFNTEAHPLPILRD